MGDDKWGCPPDCPKRTPECHGTCRRYALYCAYVAKMRKIRYMEPDTYASFWVVYKKSSNEKWSGMTRKERPTKRRR